jgi:hypothetical protein
MIRIIIIIIRHLANKPAQVQWVVFILFYFIFPDFKKILSISPKPLLPFCTVGKSSTRV